MGKLEGRVAVVAGAARGIGASCAARLRSAGADVHTFDLAGDDPVDATDASAVAAWFDRLPSAPHVLVNAVGNANLELILDQDVAEFRRILDIELAGAYICLQAAARRMKDASLPGSIITISSENEEYPTRGLSGHCAAKAGVAMLTRVAAVELGPLGIRVNAVAPGSTLTPLSAPFAELPSYARAVANSTPLGGRMGKPEEIADAVAFLASDDARWITGRSLRVDGGQSLVYVPDPLNAVEADDSSEFHSQVMS